MTRSPGGAALGAVQGGVLVNEDGQVGLSDGSRVILVDELGPLTLVEPGKALPGRTETITTLGSWFMSRDANLFIDVGYSAMDTLGDHAVLVGKRGALEIGTAGSELTSSPDDRVYGPHLLSVNDEGVMHASFYCEQFVAGTGTKTYRILRLGKNGPLSEILRLETGSTGVMVGGDAPSALPENLDGCFSGGTAAKPVVFCDLALS